MNAWLRRISFLAALLCMASLSAAAAQDESVPVIEGYVTSATSASDFFVNDKQVVCSSATSYGAQDGTKTATIPSIGKPYIGELLQVFGRQKRGTHVIEADRVVTVFVPVRLAGNGIIDRILDAPTAGEHLLRADGFPLLIQPATNVQFAPPLHSMSDIATNVWISYEGTQRADGVVVLAGAVFRQNTVQQREDKLRRKSDYDPDAVPADSHQSAASKAFLGIKVKEIPPYADDAMQARVRRIGNSLVPAYQRQLPDSDPAKIHYRFEVIDEAHRRSEYYYPAGVLLVPRQVVDRMENDDQLAEIIASGIAATMEKQDYARQPAHQKMQAGQIAADVGGVFVPGLGLAAYGVNAGVNSHIERVDGEQRRRVSLCLMHDAGYDLNEAPKAWWLLASKKPKPIANIEVPVTALYLYALLGLTWHDVSWQGSMNAALPTN